jgi:hypothetical protein
MRTAREKTDARHQPLRDTDIERRPTAAVGQIILDGKGNISGNETFSVDYTVFTVPITGTYTENADCTGTAQITPQGFSATNFATVVVNEGKELLLIETDTGTLVAGNAQE